MDILVLAATIGFLMVLAYFVSPTKSKLDEIQKPKGPVRGPDGRFVKKDK